MPVRIHGLQNKAELNDTEGVAFETLDTTDGYKVKLSSGTEMKVFRKNLQMKTTVPAKMKLFRKNLKILTTGAPTVKLFRKNLLMQVTKTEKMPEPKAFVPPVVAPKANPTTIWGGVPEGSAPGFRARICGLTNKEELNGLDGTAINEIGGKVDGYVLRLDSGKQMNVFRKNLEMPGGVTTTTPVEKFVAGPPATSQVLAPAPAATAASSSGIAWITIPDGTEPSFRIRIHSLANKAELNHMEGTTIAVIPDKDGYIVRLDNGQNIKLFRKNLQMVAEVSKTAVEKYSSPTAAVPVPSSPTPASPPSSPMPAPAPPTTDVWSAVPEGHNPPDGFAVRIHGLKNKAELNGLEGTAVSPINGDVDGYMVQLDIGKTLKIFRKNLQMAKSDHGFLWVAVPEGQLHGFSTRLHGLKNKPELNGTQGVAVEQLEGVDGYLVQLQSNLMKMKVFRKNLEMEDLSTKPVPFRVTIHDLKNKAELNGQVGSAVERLTGKVDGFVVELDSGTKLKAFRRNLMAS